MKRHLPESAFVGGLGLFSLGLWLAWPPLCPLAIGGVLMFLGFKGR